MAGFLLQFGVGVCVLAAVFGFVTRYTELLAGWDRFCLTHARKREPLRRPIEDIARDARRLGHRYRHPEPGIRFAKVEGIRRAYDAVLAEGCQALGVEHLLGVLPPGHELDLERLRVEAALWGSGLELDDAA